VVNKALTLVSFVFAGYVAIVINRWDRIRNATIGKYLKDYNRVSSVTFICLLLGISRTKNKTCWLLLFHPSLFPDS
jgi:hypothetical protein